MGLILPGKVETALEEIFKPANVEAVNRVIQKLPTVLTKVELAVAEGYMAIERCNRAAAKLESIVERVQAAIPDPK